MYSSVHLAKPKSRAPDCNKFTRLELAIQSKYCTCTLTSYKHEPTIMSCDTGQWIPCFDSSQLNITWMLNIKDIQYMYAINPPLLMVGKPWEVGCCRVIFHIDLNEGLKDIEMDKCNYGQ